MNNQLDEIIDFRQFFFKIIKNWFFFIISLLLTFSVAFAFNRYTHELYMVETSILIKEENSMATASDLLYEKSIGTSQMSLENKELVLKSFPLVYETLEDLRFDISYYIVGNIKVSETYIAPVLLVCDDISSLKGKSITIEYVNKGSFILIEEGEKHKTYSFGKEINFYNAKIKVELNPDYSLSSEQYPETVIKFKDLNAVDAKGINIKGGDYMLYPVPDLETLASFSEGECE